MKKTVSKQSAYLENLCSDDVSKQESEYYSTRFRASCNEESSIWLLKKEDKDIILFSGDCTEEAMSKALLKHSARPKILKLSHHGINRRYFSMEQLEALNPDEIIVSNSEEMRTTVYKDSIPLIKTSCKTIFTWDGDYTIKF